MSDLLLKEEF